MSVGRGPALTSVGCVVVAGLVALLGVTKPGTPPAAAVASTGPGPATQNGAPVAALVDDQGAVIVGAGKKGTTVLTGVRRSGGSSWRIVLPEGQTPLGCVGCPDVLVSAADGSLRLVSEGRSEDLRPAEPLSDAIGLPGFGPVQQDAALATTPSADAIRLSLLGVPSAMAIVRTRAGVVVPATRFQQSHAVMAVSADGATAATLATYDVLRPGEWRLVVARGAGVLQDRTVEAYVTDPSGPPQATACLSPDGTRVAFAMQAKAGVDLLSGPAEGELRRDHVAVAGRPQACDVGPAGLTLAWFDEANALFVGVVDRNGLHRTAGPFRDNVNSVQFCHGSGVVVLQGDRGTAIVRPGKRPQRVASTSFSGCTTAGTPWFIGGRQVSWLKTS